MITNHRFNSVVQEIRRENLETYWNGYFSYRDEAGDLHALSQRALTDEVNSARSNDQPFVDSQQVISKVLTDFGNRHNFHRQFNERFTDLRPHQVLGMQLYTIMVADEEIWVFQETQHAGHVFPHATYFMPRENDEYQRIIRNYS